MSLNRSQELRKTVAAPAPARFNVLIVDPDSASRGKLKQAALSLGKFNKVHTTSSTDEALGKTDGVDVIDVVFISYRFSEQQIKEFIAKCKTSKAGAEWAFILVVQAAGQSNEAVANALLGGANGFLFEPYAADDLRAIAELTAQVKSENEDRRKRAAAMILFAEVISHVDAMAVLQAKGRDIKMAKKRLEEKSKALANLKKTDPTIFIESAIEAFGKAPLVGGNRYSGVSKRVKAKLEQQLLKELDTKYAGES